MLNSYKSLLRAGLTLGLLAVIVGCDNAGPVVGPELVSGHPGKARYNEYCYSCHTPGIAGAPRLGDALAWAPRLAKGRALLVQSTIKGLAPGMPARGLCYSCTDEELADAVDYMIAAVEGVPN